MYLFIHKYTMLTTTARHALRALVELTNQSAHGPLLARELAESAGIPPKYIYRILQSLSSAGILQATRGIGGGYKLRRRPERIRLIEVVELFDPPRTSQGCLPSNAGPYSNVDPCDAHSAWRKLQAAHCRFLEATSLAEIARQNKRRLYRRKRS